MARRAFLHARLEFAASVLLACGTSGPVQSAETSDDDGDDSDASDSDSDSSGDDTESETESTGSDASDTHIICDFHPATETGEPACTGEKVVHFVYFVEADQTYSEAQRDDIESFAFEFQQYFYDQLGVTFYLGDPVVEVVMADHSADWYVTTPDGIHSDDRWYRLGNIKSEVYAKLGIVDFDPNRRVVNYPVARFDGRVGVNFGGAWMDGDDLSCISDGGPTYPYDKGGPAHCMGHPAHEFGHVLGLDHTGPNDDCMQFGFYNNTGGEGMCNFYEDNVAEILADPLNEGWLDALPGDACVGI